MKKLVVLMLVVGMASLASAAFTVTTSASTMNVNGSVTIYIENDSATQLVDTDWWLAITSATNSKGAWDQTGPSMVFDSGSVMPTTGSVSYIGDGMMDGRMFVRLQSDASNNPIGIGAMASYTLKGVALGDIDLQLYDSSIATIASGTATVTVVPEPMTMALLGLGGLFLRRKK